MQATAQYSFIRQDTWSCKDNSHFLGVILHLFCIFLILLLGAAGGGDNFRFPSTLGYVTMSFRVIAISECEGRGTQKMLSFWIYEGAQVNCVIF